MAHKAELLLSTKHRRSILASALAACLLVGLCLTVRDLTFISLPATGRRASTLTEARVEIRQSASGQWSAAEIKTQPQSTVGLLVVAGAAVAALASMRVQSTRPSGSNQTSSRIALQARGGAENAPIVVIAGPPAAGKGTQCERIKTKYGLVHISTGDILRENVKNGTELGVKAKEYMDAGALVPSELIVDLVKDRLVQDDIKQNGCLLDGFPRAPDQAQAMVDAGVKVDKFLLIEVPDDTLVERGCGRRLDPESGEIYHLKFKPPPAEIVDRLVHRSDDQEDKIRARLQAYHSQIDGILPFFGDVAVKLDGTGTPDDVFALVTAGLDGI